MAEPEETVLALINAASIANVKVTTVTDGILDGNLVRGDDRPSVNGGPTGAAIFVQEQGGQTPYPFLGVSMMHRRETVRVAVRSGAQQYDAGMTLARAAWTACHNKTPTGYYACFCRQGGPIPNGVDSELQYHFFFDVDLGRVTT
jgi:hypothetical protein